MRISAPWTFMILLCLSSMAKGAADDLGKIWQNNRAVDLQSKKKVGESLDEFAKLLAKDPFQPLFQYLSLIHI